MWFLMFSTGALALGLLGLPAAGRLPVPPPPEAVLACYFLAAALLRLLVRDARLAAFERKARAEARREEDRPGSAMGQLGLGVGRGVLQAAGGDVIMAGLSLAAALMRGAAASVSAPPPPRRERRRAAQWERLRATVSILAVGLVCAGVAWEPLLHVRLVRAARAAVGARLGTPPPSEPPHSEPPPSEPPHSEPPHSEPPPSEPPPGAPPPATWR